MLKKGKESENRSNSEAKRPTILTTDGVLQHPAKYWSTYIDKYYALLYSKRQNKMVDTFSSVEVSQITGTSCRQLAYWDVTGLLKPSVRSASGRGSRRLYSIRDLVELEIIVRLLTRSLSLQRIRSSFQFIRALPEPLEDLIILTDGDTIYLYKGEDAFLDTAKQQGQTAFRIVVEDLISEVEGRVGQVTTPQIAVHHSYERQKERYGQAVRQ